MYYTHFVPECKPSLAPSSGFPAVPAGFRLVFNRGHRLLQLIRPFGPGLFLLRGPFFGFHSLGLFLLRCRLDRSLGLRLPVGVFPLHGLAKLSLSLLRSPLAASPLRRPGSGRLGPGAVRLRFRLQRFLFPFGPFILKLNLGQLPRDLAFPLPLCGGALPGRFLFARRFRGFLRLRFRGFLRLRFRRCRLRPGEFLVLFFRRFLSAAQLPGALPDLGGFRPFPRGISLFLRVWCLFRPGQAPRTARRG